MTERYIVLSSDNESPMVWLAQRELDRRWDSTFFDPEYLGNQEALENSGYPLIPLRRTVRKMSDGPFGSHLKVSEYTEQGIPLFRAQNVQEFFIDLTNLVFITAEKHQELSRSAVQPGDVLLTKTGAYLGKAAVLPETIPTANITSHIVLFRLKQAWYPWYLAAFLNSVYGHAQVRRWSHKATRPEFNLQEIGQVLVPLPPIAVQKAIGDKVRRAVVLHEEADRIQANALVLFDEAVGIGGLTKSLAGVGLSDWDWILTRELEGRWDAEFFHGQYTALDNYFEQYPFSVDQLGRHIAVIERGITPPFASEGIPLLRVADIDPYTIDLAKVRFIEPETHARMSRSQLEADDVVLTVTGPPLGEAALVPKWLLPANINNHIAKMGLKQSIPVGYVVFFLNSLLGQMQVQRFCYGIRQKDLYNGDIRQFRIPRLESAVESRLDENLRAMLEKRHDAQQLLVEAKSDVEALIRGEQGTISE